MSAAKRILVSFLPSDYTGTIYDHIEFPGIYQVVFREVV